MQIVTVVKDAFTISTSKEKLQVAVIHDYLANQSYWAANIPLQIVEQTIQHSLCFGLYHNETQIGYARLITDYCTFAYLADVFLLPAYRGQGLAKWMMEIMIEHPNLQGLRRWLLATRDAHELYRKIGFEPLDKPQNIMQRKDLLNY